MIMSQEILAMTLANAPELANVVERAMMNSKLRLGRAETQLQVAEVDAAYDTIEVELDPDLPMFWCWMCPTGGPIVTNELLMDLKTMHRSLPSILEAQSARPVQYYVFGSRARGTYSLGGDLSFFAECIRTGNRTAVHRYAHHCIDVVWQHVIAFNYPLITMALVQGDALGGGFETALSCDVIIAEKQSKLGLPEVLFNLFPGMGAYSFLTRRIGPAEAHRMVTSGTIYSAEQLHAMGIVDVLAEPGEGAYAARDYVKSNQRRHNAQRAANLARKRVNPVTESELRDIVDVWVDAVFRLTETDLRRMARLVAAQERRRTHTDAYQIAAE
jgi:DSF synthase